MKSHNVCGCFKIAIRWFTLYIFFAIVLVLTQADEIERLPLQKIQIGSKSIEVEVADELHERQRGLMYRKTMDADHGMIFVYGAEPRSFWMKNTYIPLSIAYIGPDCKIVHIANMIPGLPRSPFYSSSTVCVG